MRGYGLEKGIRLPEVTAVRSPEAAGRGRPARPQTVRVPEGVRANTKAAFPPHTAGGDRFSSGDMQGGRTSLYPAGEKPGTDGPGGNAPAGKDGPRAQADPDAIKVRGQSIRTAEHRIRTTAEHTRRAAQRAKKTASEARRAAQRAAKEAAKTAAKTSEKAAKTTARTLKEVTEAIFKAVSSLIEKLGGALASGGPVVLVIIAAAVYLSVIMYKIGDIADKFLSIFSLGGAIVWEGDVENLEEMIKDAHLEPNPAILDLNESYHYRLDRIIENNRYDEVVLEDPDPDWGDILGFWAAWQLCENGGEFPDFADGQMEGLSEVFNDMIMVEFEVTEAVEENTGDSDITGGTSGSEPGEGGAHGADEGEENDENPEPDEEEENEKLILTITVSQLSIEEMAELYEMGGDGEEYIELMTDGSLFEVINILTKYIGGYELPEESEESESGGHPGGGGSF